MSPIRRRHFLQFAGSTLATIGLSQLDFLQQGERYARVLAQGTPGRKLALLVGVNAYSAGIPDLRGCLTDVEMQWELLVHRFGFSPKDILVVADQKLSFTDYQPQEPTRQNILQAFEKHLIQQAKPGDVVVFHFSGHGSLVRDPNPLSELVVNENGVKKRVPNTEGVIGTIVPKDRSSSNPDQVQDIMGRSLFLLMQALNTENVTLVLDSCHSGGGTRGNLLFRAASPRLNDQDLFKPSQEELAFQERWMKNLKLTPEALNKLRSKGIAKGVAIGSAQYDQLAADAPFDDESFYAGAFTYLLTRYLWQQSVDESIGTVFVNLARSTRDVADRSGVTQEPIFAANPESNSQKPAYFLQPITPFAEAVVRPLSPEGKIQYWLGGISSLSLTANKSGSIFSVIDKTGKEIAQIEQTTRRGLIATGKLKSGKLADIQPGALLRERVRGLSSDLKLRVGLDPSLGKDLETVKTALQGVDRIAVVGSEQTMNYRLGRMTSAYDSQSRQRGIAALPKVGSTGLFTGDLRPLAATFNEPEEGIEDAIARLTPRLKSFLAAEVLKAIGGADVIKGQKSADLMVEIQPTGKTGAKIGANRFQPGTTIQVQIKNTSNRDLYVAVIAIGDAGRMRVLFPYVDAPEGRERVVAGQTLALPEKDVTFPLSKTPGMLEIMVLASADSVRDAVKALKEIGARGRGVSSSRGFAPEPLQGDEAVDVVGALLGNIDKNTRSDIGVSRDVRAVDANRYAVISTTVEVVPG